MTPLTQKIDVHHHLIPPAFAQALARSGFQELVGAPLPAWSPESSIETMDMDGIGTAILSLSNPGVYFGDLQEACKLARDCNEYAAEVGSTYPDRFGSFSVLPMPFTEQACREAEYALDTLKADGIVLLGSTEGKFLGNPQFDELMAELNRRKAVVFLHPNLHPTSTTLGLQAPGFLVEFLCDTTRAATNLILSGTVEKYDSIRWILAHAGGFLPYIAWRLSLANGMPEYARKMPAGMLTYIRRFYYDTALSPSPFAMAALRQLVDPSHILFGSDFPFAPHVAVALQVSGFQELTVLSDEEKSAIARSNSFALFPRLGTASPSVIKTPGKASFKRAIVKPLIAVANQLRDR